jgi:uncharacterized surface protein with fasciclin (FAS1) repeats
MENFMRSLRIVFGSFRLLAAVFLVVGMVVNVAALAGGHSAAKQATQGDIVDVAVDAGTFATLVAAVQAAELVDALKGEGPYTVFAPTDEAFAALPEGTVENLLKPENQAQLQAVLLYHVVPGKVMKSDLESGSLDAETLQGSTVEIIKSEGWTEKQRLITVNGANVVTADVAASNGVIHVIDAVILPPQPMAAN